MHRGLTYHKYTGSQSTLEVVCNLHYPQRFLREVDIAIVLHCNLRLLCILVHFDFQSTVHLSRQASHSTLADENQMQSEMPPTATVDGYCIKRSALQIAVSITFVLSYMRRSIVLSV